MPSSPALKKPIKQSKTKAKSTAKTAASTPKPAAKPLKAAQVLAFLESHPSFLSQNAAKLAQKAQAPKRVGNIFALHAARAGVAESKASSLIKRLTQFTAIAKANAAATAQAHAAILVLMENAATPASFRKALQGPFKPLLGLQQARLMLLGPTTTATTLSAPDLNKICPENLWLGNVTLAHQPLFGPQTATLRSAALLRLGTEEAPLGLLALASEDPSHFHAGQATELLEFLRAASSAMVKPWANR